MLKKPFGKTGEKVSEIGLGTFYDARWIILAMLGFKSREERKLEALKVGLEGGINLIDTAEIYKTEPLVAKAIKGIKREDLFIVTKVWSNHLRREALLKALDSSLKRLEVKYVDLYLVHWPNPRIPISETMGAMEEAIDKGKTRYIGLSNFSLKQIIEAQEALRKYEIVSVQLEYNLMNRKVEKDILPYCERNGIAFMAYYPLAHGKLLKKRDKLKELCEKYNKTLAQIALNWLASKEKVFPIPRASNPYHVKENLGASGWRLSEEDIKKLEDLFPLT